ncbi:hypothetical protein ABZ552_16260 [Nocardia sp. NPDC019219]|uniref:hypothetical protein n=1 Tax=Nocardia TaxID=1817 RepID=UPI0024928D37|nr:hypothetical protein [Nocardia sputorum]
MIADDVALDVTDERMRFRGEADEGLCDFDDRCADLPPWLRKCVTAWPWLPDLG